MDIKDNVEDLIGHAAQYFDTRRKWVVASVAEKSAGFASEGISALAVGIMLLLGVFFLTIALGFYLAKLYGNAALGFLTVAGAYFLIALLLHTVGKKIIREKVSETVYEKIILENEE